MTTFYCLGCHSMRAHLEIDAYSSFTAYGCMYSNITVNGVSEPGLTCASRQQFSLIIIFKILFIMIMNETHSNHQQ